MFDVTLCDSHVMVFFAYRLNVLLNVLDLCVACFEYRVCILTTHTIGQGVPAFSVPQGKRNLSNQPSNIGSMPKGSNVRMQLANAILRGEGTARERMSRRKAGAQAGGMEEQCKTVLV